MIAQKLRASNLRVSLVPTSGNLHEGHFELVRQAKEISDVVMVSILQVPGTLSTDVSRNRPFLARDVEQLAPLDPGYMFAPDALDLMPGGFSTEVRVRALTDRLYGGLRPGHYIQKATVLTLLFNMISPHRVHLGEKDLQELALVKRLIRELAYDIEIIISPIIREEDGVAAGAELQWLASEERRAAGVLHRGLKRAQVLFGAGERDAVSLLRSVREIIEGEPLARVDFLSVIHADTLEPISTIGDEPAAMAGAVQIGEVRLLDNVWLNP
ncbi:MAG: pantoate--beta-alanine ligase [Acidobacteria bacterium]|nr:pantoate--beta-alanine ligase [Acidobacteriota bacterium]